MQGSDQLQQCDNLHNMQNEMHCDVVIFYCSCWSIPLLARPAGERFAGERSGNHR